MSGVGGAIFASFKIASLDDSTPSQAIMPRSDGAIEVMLRLNNLIGIERRILACGAHAEVLAPVRAARNNPLRCRRDACPPRWCRVVARRRAAFEPRGVGESFPMSLAPDFPGPPKETNKLFTGSANVPPRVIVSAALNRNTRRPAALLKCPRDKPVWQSKVFVCFRRCLPRRNWRQLGSPVEKQTTRSGVGRYGNIRFRSIRAVHCWPTPSWRKPNLDRTSAEHLA
jgi:hypothetical protein